MTTNPDASGAHLSIVPPPDVPEEYLDPLAAITDLKDRVKLLELSMTHLPDVFSATPIPISSPNDDLLLALARVDQSLRIVLLAIHEIQREMGITHTPDVPLKPDPTWNGSP